MSGWNSRQRLVQRNIAVAITTHAFLVANGFGKSLAQGNADVFNRVVIVNLEVALGLHHQVDQTVACNLVKHVVQKGNARAERALAGAIESDRDLDLGLCGVALNLCCAINGRHRPDDTFAR